MRYSSVAQRFSVIMGRRNITARELSEKSGVSEASISQYCSGTHKPSNISSGKMAEVLNVNPLWLMGYDVPMNKTAAIDSSENSDKKVTAQDNVALRYASLLHEAGFALKSSEDYSDVFALAADQSLNGLAVNISFDELQELNIQIEKMTAEIAQDFMIKKWNDILSNLPKR